MTNFCSYAFLVNPSFILQFYHLYLSFLIGKIPSLYKNSYLEYNNTLPCFCYTKFRCVLYNAQKYYTNLYIIVKKLQVFLFMFVNTFLKKLIQVSTIWFLVKIPICYLLLKIMFFLIKYHLKFYNFTHFFYLILVSVNKKSSLLGKS